MADPFLGEIRLVGFNFPPRGWATCSGQLLPISQNSALFSLIGTIYGGDGRTTFGLPDLQGRIGIGHGSGPGLSSYVLGQRLGTESHTLITNQMPNHNHLMAVSDEQASTSDPRDGVFAVPNVHQRMQNLYDASPGAANMASDMVGNSGATQAHENRQPYLAVLFTIALSGVFPSRS